MLAGRWHQGWQWRRAKPAVVLCALYDYAYRAEDGRQVAMAAGEQLLLLHKANEDWWQVRRAGEPHWARPFFVPATYVAELDPGDTGRWSMRPPSQPEDTGLRQHRCSLEDPPQEAGPTPSSPAGRCTSTSTVPTPPALPRCPSLQEPLAKGAGVFGCRLAALCQREGSAVPRFVRLCVEAVEEKGLDVDGIYRVNGSLSVIQKLRFTVDRERAVTSDGRYVFPEQLSQEERLNLADPEWSDVHVVAGALKLFLRELPEPLVPYRLFGAFMDALKLPGCQEQVKRVAELVQSLPPANYATLRYLLAHLCRVMERADVNRMTCHNIGIVFGPTLLRPEREPGSLAADVAQQSQAVELLLAHFDCIFPTPP
ncbi:hypothetical protein AV530_008986 [Patagioenas fasciata monilis]|uniref:Rho GTPase-activating protein 9 n=1 Tax=Patagioenas fasciata monilis TaxID=372326 RepID=A0A1V4L0I0_PATFA|nr:hypothetical protein AV530_008986 [Patagioenas fasciata monilis]